MKEEHSLIEKITDKIHQLIKERDALRDRVSELLFENENLKTSLKNIDNKHETAESGNNIEEERLKQLKKAVKQLDQYTKELDECIQWIEKN